MKIDNIKLFAKLLGLTEKEILEAAEQSRFTSKKWTEEELNTLIELVDAEVPPVDIARQLNRSASSVYSKIKRLPPIEIEWTKSQIYDFDYRVGEQEMPLSEWASINGVSIWAAKGLHIARLAEYDRLSSIKGPED